MPKRVSQRWQLYTSRSFCSSYDCMTTSRCITQSRAIIVIIWVWVYGIYRCRLYQMALYGFILLSFQDSDNKLYWLINWLPIQLHCTYHNLTAQALEITHKLTEKKSKGSPDKVQQWWLWRKNRSYCWAESCAAHYGAALVFELFL